MVLVYLLIKLGDLSWANVGKYSSTMEHMGYIKKYISFYPRNAYIYISGRHGVATCRNITIDPNHTFCFDRSLLGQSPRFWLIHTNHTIFHRQSVSEKCNSNMG